MCVHCVRAEGVTDDHGVPVSWYPLSSAADRPRVKAPACRACNARLKMLEEEVLVPLILSIDPRDARVAGIAERIRRSMDVAYARDEKDARERAAKRARLEAQLFVPESDVGAFPGAEREGRSAEALPLRGAAIEAIAEKVARVVLYAARPTRAGAHRPAWRGDGAHRRHDSWGRDLQRAAGHLRRGAASGGRSRYGALRRRPLGALPSVRVDPAARCRARGCEPLMGYDRGAGPSGPARTE